VSNAISLCLNLVVSVLLHVQPFFILQATSCIKSNQIQDLVERNCLEEVSIERIESVLQIALQCISPTPEERPTMDRVVLLLEADTLSSCLSDLSNFYNSPISEHEGRGR
jgi:hypothetical protein